MNVISVSATILALSMGSGASLASVSLSEAAKLGKELTNLGGEKAGNVSGSIPAYTGGLAQNLNVDPFKDIYANEKPLFIISKVNLAQYQDNLTPGQVAMFNKYPDTYTMPIYTSHRTANSPKYIQVKVKKNATTAKLLDGGNGVSHFDESIPFAIPKSGVEVIWNHITRFRGGSAQVNVAAIPVEANGDFSIIRSLVQFSTPQYLKESYNKKKDDNILFYLTSKNLSPARLTGNIILVHETLDQVSEPRKAWMYNAGQRRVRRAPQVAYDAPASSGMRTLDQGDMYNGAPDRYDWELMGKKEVYIPYNSYKLADRKVKYADIIDVGHINQDYTRYELHRVWHVKATIKEGSRHIYGQRDFYLDEDSWQVVVADHYDNRDELWRVSEAHSMQFVNANTTYFVGQTVNDLSSGRYVAELSNEEQNGFTFGTKLSRRTFSASALRRSGKR